MHGGWEGWMGERGYMPGEHGYIPGERDYMPGKSGYMQAERSYSAHCVRQRTLLGPKIITLSKVLLEETHGEREARGGGVAVTVLIVDENGYAQN